MTMDPEDKSDAMEGASYAFTGGGEAWDIYRLLVENSYDLVGEIDDQGAYVYINPSYSRALGYSLAEVLQKNAFDFIHPQDGSNHFRIRKDRGKRRPTSREFGQRQQ